MRWIELNDGSFVNTEKLAGVSADIKTHKVYYSFGTGDDMALETFGTAAAMERRMQQLRQMLLPHDAAKEILEHTIPYTTP